MASSKFTSFLKPNSCCTCTQNMQKYSVMVHVHSTSRSTSNMHRHAIHAITDRPGGSFFPASLAHFFSFTHFGLVSYPERAYERPLARFYFARWYMVLPDVTRMFVRKYQARRKQFASGEAKGLRSSLCARRSPPREARKFFGI